MNIQMTALPFSRNEKQVNSAYNDNPTIVKEYENLYCQECDCCQCPHGCFDSAHECAKSCSQCCACCSVKDTDYHVKTGQSLVVTYKGDIYGHVVGPGKLNVCCYTKKSFYWINSGIQTVLVEDVNVTDKNLHPVNVGFVITYRITDLMNYCFNLK